jgi:hypothetical protein
MALRFVQDYGNAYPSWSYYYSDIKGGHLELGGNQAADKIYDLLLQTSNSPYVQFYLYPNGVDIKPMDGSNLATKIYYTTNTVNLTVGIGYSHFGNIYSNGSESSFIAQNNDTTYYSAIASDLTKAQSLQITPFYGIYNEAGSSYAYSYMTNASENVVLQTYIEPTLVGLDINNSIYQITEELSSSDGQIFLKRIDGNTFFTAKCTPSTSSLSLASSNGAFAIYGESDSTSAYLGVQTTTSSIYLDTSSIPAGAGSKDITIKEITLCVNGLTKKMLILASDPYV